MKYLYVFLASCALSCALSCAPSYAQDWQPAHITRTSDGREWYHDGSRWVEVTRTQCQGGQCNPNGIYYRQVPQQQPQEWSQPAPQYQPRPIPDASNGVAILEWRRQIERKLLALEAKCGQAGQPGPAGPMGPPGPCGPAGTGISVEQVTQLKNEITTAVSQNVNTQVDVDKLAEAIAKTLPPVRVEWITLDGTVLKQEKPLGEVLKFQTTESVRK